MEKKLQNQRKRFRILSFIFSLLVIFLSFGVEGQISSFPYTEDFGAADATTSNSPNGAGYAVNLAKSGGVTGNCAGIDYQTSSTNDSWFWIYFSATSGKEYTIDFYEKQCTKIYVYIGATKTTAAMEGTSAVYSQNSYIAAFTQRTASAWTAPSTGDFYVAFKVVNSTTYTGRIDDVTITETTPGFFWVGGSGNWSDYANHWSSTSGGAADQPNAPTTSDNVYFDANSFSAPGQTVSIDADAYCKNMDWTGATNSPTLDFPNLAPSYYDLYIAGSATFIAAMSITNNNAAYIYYTSTSAGETITTNGLSIPCKFIFNGSGGEWTLQDNLTASSSTWDFEVLTGASVISNGYTISGFGDLVVSGTGVLNLSTSTASFANTATISGTVSISTGTLDVNDTFNATGGNLTFSGAGNLNLGGATNTSLGTFTESTSTVTYDRVGAQGVIAETYYNLVIAGGSSAIKTAAGTVNVSNDFTVNSSTFYAVAATTTTVNGSSLNNGTITISTGTFDAVGAFTGTSGSITFTGSGNLRFGAACNGVGTFTASTSTVTWYGATSNTGAVRAVTYYNAVIAAGTKGLSGTATVSNNFTVDVGATFVTNASTLNVTGTSDINGTISMSTGTFNADGTFDATGGAVTFTGAGNLNLGGATVTSLGTLTEGTGTVSYDRAGAQSVLADTYYNLTIAGGASNIKTAAGAVNVSNNMTVDASTEYALAATTTTVTGVSDINGTISMSTGTYDANGTFDATGGAVTFSDDGFLYLGSTVTSLGTLTTSYGANATTGCTVVYDAAGDQTVDAVDYYNLTIDGSGTKTAAGGFDIGGSNGEGVLTVDTGCTFAIGDNTITHTSLHDFSTTYNSSIVGTVTINNGIWTATYGQYGQLVTSGAITVTGTGTIYLRGGGGHTLGTLTAGSGTIYYSRNGNQTVHSNTYYHLIIDGTSGTKTLGGAIDVNGDLTLTSNGGGLLDVSGSNYAINLAGTWTNNGTFTAQSGTVTLDGGSNQSIAGTTSTTFYNLTNSNSATTVTLNQGITVTNTLAMSGTADIDMNANNIDLSSAGTISGESDSDRIYDTAGTTDVSGVITTTRVLNAPSSENVGGMGAVITSAANLGSTTIKRGHLQQTGNANTSILRYYSITPTTNTGLNATLEFNYFESELNGQSANEADFVLFRSTDGGTNWTNKSGVANAAGNNVTLSAIDAFSLWTTSSESVSPLPITLLSFNAIPLEDMVELKWVTASENNSHLFEIEKSINGIDFDVITTIKAAGESIELLNYTEYDRSPTQGLSYYRLKQIDNDGKYNYSNIVSVVYGSKSMVKLIPNPSNGLIATLMLKDLNYNNENDATLEVYSSTGELVYSKVVKMTNISFTISPEKRFAPGYYTVKLAQENKIIANEKMIVQW